MESESSILELKNKQYVLDKERQTLLINDFKTSEIYKKYHDAKSPLPASDRHELITCIDNTFNNFSHRLTKLYPKMRDDELYICCMIKTGLSPKEISNITMLKPNSLSMTRTRLYQKIFGKKGSATDFDSFIRSFWHFHIASFPATYVARNHFVNFCEQLFFFFCGQTITFAAKIVRPWKKESF